ncbi:MAG: hypothetical protein L0Z53_03170, partial [Acidobacteriales bacterium]|nr:hypothetical protein [Terriglobales bacterium]
MVVALFSAVLGARAAAPNGIAAIINETIITYHEVQMYTFQAVDLLRRTYGRNPEAFNEKYTQTMLDGLE